MSTEAEKWLAQVEMLPESDYTVIEIQDAVDALVSLNVLSDEGEFWEEAGNQLYGTGFLNLRGVEVSVSKVFESGGYDDSPYKVVVVKVKEQTFKKTGYYSSYDGTEWDSGVRETHPVQKTVTEWD